MGWVSVGEIVIILLGHQKIFMPRPPDYTTVWFGKPDLFTPGCLDIGEFRFDPFLY